MPVPVAYAYPRPRARVPLRSLSLLLAAACARPSPDVPAPTTRNYYVAAEEVEWEYVPGGENALTGEPHEQLAYFQKAGAVRVPTSYKKALFFGYADETFEERLSRPLEWKHLGFLGPLIRGVVGDTIRVVFRNRTSRPVGLHPHGVFYLKDSEGAPYEDGTSGTDKADDAVPPGGEHVYVWPVPERAGPGPGDLSSVMWMYHSHTDEVGDVNAGLVGPMVVTGREHARADGSPSDVDRELVTMFAQTNELQSPYWGENWGRVLAANPALAEDGPAPNPDPFLFLPASTFFSINGFVHSTLPVEWLTVKRGERVRWYVFASTNDFDFHTPHWHGNVVLVNGMRMDVTALEPMEMLIADMVPDNPGIWLYHCHVSIHLIPGMAARYQVEG